MALGFFRKRQKMIFVIMVVLMVSFLIGYQGFSMFFQKNPSKIVIGETPDFEITLGKVNDARNDLETLQWLGRGFGRYTFQGAAFDALYLSTPRADERALLYALLLRQAQEDDFAVADVEVDSLIQQMKSNGMDFDAYATHMRQNQGVPLKQLRALLARWLLICKACQANQIVTPPSRDQLERLFRDIAEKMDLKVVKIPAQDFLQGIGEPTDAQVTELFEAHKNRPAGTFAGLDSFSFGYLTPARVQLAYLFISQNAILRSSIPTDGEIADYIKNNGDKLVKTSGEGDTVKTAPMSYPEKRAAAIQALQPELAQAKFNQILERIRQLANQEKTSRAEGPAKNVYAEVVRKLTLPADDLLQRKVPVLALEKQPLEKAVDMLAQAADPRIGAICFPYGRHGKVKIAPDLKITLNARNITVGEALAKIAARIPDLPKLQWGMCEGIDNVLFSVDGVRFFPATAGRTGLETQEQINDDPMLSKCFSRQPPASLAQLAMRVQTIEPTSKFLVNQDGPPLRVWDPDNGGAILWRVTAAEAPQSPETLTDEIRKQVVRDWKLRQAFPKAIAQADAIKNAADLEAYIKAKKSKTVETGLFARKAPRGDRQMLMFLPTRLTVLNFSSPAVDGEVVKEAFAALAPKNLSADYPKESQNVLTLPLPSEGYVLVARRIDFEPAEKKAFEESKPGLIQLLQQRQAGQSLLEWFTMDNAEKRTGYVPKKPERQEATDEPEA
ncbi:MAG: hypothetical protein JXA11_15270 [Phycisphaerae bacterium]|nr:hypothetical protein [Phycisphaerae bacterium]